MNPTITPTDILTFWKAAGHDRWYAKDDAFDADIRTRFGALWQQAADGKLGAWEATDDGALALVILLDQFPRNMYRGSPKMFSTDARAREVATRAIARGADRRVDTELRAFFYLPFEHSEATVDQQRSVELFEATGDAELMKYAIIHRDIIAKFGRFPHRNPILGRAMRPDEQAYLDAEGFKG